MTSTRSAYLMLSTDKNLNTEYEVSAAHQNNRDVDFSPVKSFLVQNDETCCGLKNVWPSINHHSASGVVPFSAMYIPAHAPDSGPVAVREHGKLTCVVVPLQNTL